jgi:uncharacterized membrane protein YhaH (DUF805 family)
MTAVLERYFAFHGRLARLPFFIRNLYLGLAASVLFIISIPLFANGGLWWWLGIFYVIASLACLGVGIVALLVRRLHDLGLSGYHAIWVAAAQNIWAFLANAPPKVMLLGLPLAAICFWVTFWPGNKEANRFGPVPD